MYSLHDIKVPALPLGGILGCSITSHAGEHSTLMLLALADGEAELIEELPDCQDVEVLLRQGDEDRVIFSGVVTGIRISESGNVRTALIEGKSRSWLMDRKQRSRSFQDPQASIQAVAREVLGEYEDSDLIYAAPDQPIGSILVQYKETDWAFLRRVLSRAGLMPTPDSSQRGLKLYAGIPALEQADCSYYVLEMDKDMDTYYGLQANGRAVCSSDFTRYLVSSEQLIGILQPVNVQGQPLVAYSCSYSFENGGMTGFYGLQAPGGLQAAAIYPMHLIGVALTGKVVHVAGHKVQVALEIDGGSPGRAVFPFPYSTLSASTDGSGWYYMPEIGDDVRVYFPSKLEGEAIALSAVSNYMPKKGKRDYMQDPNSRYLRTRTGQELALAPGYIRLSSGWGASSLTVRSDGKVTVQADLKVEAGAEEEMILHAEDSLTVHAREEFTLLSFNGGQIYAKDGNISIMGTEVKLD